MRKRLDQLAATLLRVELLIVMLATVAGMAASSLLPVAVAVIGLMLLIRALFSLSTTGRLQIAHTPADLPLILLIGTIVVTLWATPRLDITLPQVLRLLTGIGLFVALANNRTLVVKRASLIATGIALLGILLTFSMPFTVEWSGASKLAFVPSSLYQRFTLIVSDGINPNVMAGAIVLLFPVAVAQLFKPSSLPRTIFYALAVLVMLAGLVLAGSRSAFLAGAASGFIVLVIHLPRKYAGLLAGLIVLAVIVLVTVGQLFESQFGAALNGMLTTNDALSGSLSRMEIWSRAIYIIQDFPFTGIGMGLFAPVTDLLYPMIITRPGIEHAHNLMLQIGVDLGLPGLVTWLALYFIVMVCLLTRISRKSLPDKGLVVGLFGAQIALIFGGITDAVTWGMVRSAPLVWGLWGLAIAIWLSTSQHDYTMD